MNLGANIHRHRTLSSMSQGDLANALEVSRQSVSKWENNSAQPELDKLCKMSALFGVTLDELVYDNSAFPRGKYDAAPETLKEPLPPRAFLGSALLIFGLVFFLVLAFLSDPMSASQAPGKLLAANLILIGLSLLTTYSTPMLSGCMIVYAAYNIIGFGFFKEIGLPGSLLSATTGVTLLVWFIAWGMHSGKKEKTLRFRSE